MLLKETRGLFYRVISVLLKVVRKTYSELLISGSNYKRGYPKHELENYVFSRLWVKNR